MQACISAQSNCTDLVHFLLPLAVRFGVIQRSLPLLLLVGVAKVWRCHPTASTMMKRGRGGGGRVWGSYSRARAGQAALSFDGLLHAQVQSSVLVHLDVHFLDRPNIKCGHYYIEDWGYIKSCDITSLPSGLLWITQVSHTFI